MKVICVAEEPTCGIENSLFAQVFDGLFSEESGVIKITSVGTVLILHLDHDDVASVVNHHGLQDRRHQCVPPGLHVRQIVGVAGPQLDIGMQLVKPPGKAPAIVLCANVWP